MFIQLNIRLSFQITVTHLYRWVGKEVLRVKCSDEKSNDSIIGYA